MTGLFITFEGGEGAGKTTQARKLKDFLETSGHDVVLTREPGGTPESEKIRDLLVQRDGGDWTPIAECALFFAARQMHIEQLIRPALKNGKFVICDRFTDSSRAYQGYGHGFSLEVIEAMDDLVTGKFEPDLTFVFDLPIEAGIGRSNGLNAASEGQIKTEDRFERLNHDFHERMRQGFLAIAEKNPLRCHVIDATLDIDEIHQSVVRIVREKIDHAV